MRIFSLLVVRVLSSMVFSPEIPIGETLGAFKNELKDPTDSIEVFAGAGLKSYGYKTCKGVVECKLKGISLDYDASREINLNTLIKMVTQDKDMIDKVTYPRHDVTRIQNKEETKTFRFVFDKQVLRGPGHMTYPFGYRGPLIDE